MQDNEKREFRDIVTATMDVYGKETSPDVLRIWWASLQNFSIDEVRSGFSKYVRSTEYGRFAPKPADIITMIEGTTSDRGMIAWEKVREAIGRAGGYRSVCFDDEIIHVVIEGMGGWPTLCATEKEELPFRAAEFAKRYRAHSEAGVPAYPAYLVGRSEASNGMNGFKSDPPLLIGNPEKASAVLAFGSDKPLLRITSGKSIEDLATLAVKKIGYS